MNAPVQMAEIARIAELVNYDPQTGIFTRKRHMGSRWRSGTPCGGRDAKGYVILKIDGVVVKAHRLAWFITHGKMPSLIDHINGDKADNRIINLRDVPKRVNALNSWKPNSNNRRTGLRGVSKCSGKSRQWVARITKDGKRVHLGCFYSPEEAHQHYLKVKRQQLAEALNAS